MRYLFASCILFFMVLLIYSCETKELGNNLIKHTGITRSLALLQTSTFENPKAIDVYFYGQSIVGGMKSTLLIDSLKKVYPSVEITTSNKAIGGFTAPSLLKTAEHDLYQENPDLLIFHAYGGIKNGEFDSLIHSIRKRMGTEILLFDHHFVWDTSQARLRSRNKIDSIESVEIKKIAKKYDCGYINLREQWAAYLKQNHLGANVLIGDTINPEVHPNDAGDKLLRDIIIKHILESKESNYDPDKDALRQSIRLDQGKRTTRKNVLGNRLELVFDTIVDNGTTIQVLIDGMTPSSIRSSYYITRPSIGYKSWMPMIKKISFGEAFPREEDWELTFYDIDRQNKTFTYEVEGSITGYDGTGNSNTNFESNSKRIKINKEDFYLFDIERIIGEQTPSEFTVKFKVSSLVEDTLKLKTNALKYTIFRGWESQRHTLKLKTLTGKSNPAELIVFRPYLEKDES